MVSTVLRGTERVGNYRIQRNEYDVDDNAGGKDDREYDVACRPTSFATWLAQLSEEQREWEIIQYNVTSTMSMTMPAARAIANKTWHVGQRASRHGYHSSQRNREWEVLQYNATSMMLMRIPAVWMLSSKTR